MALLPAEFAGLEPFSDWVLETERERYAKRLATSMQEMQAFYDVAFPRLAEATKYLEDYPLGQPTFQEPQRNLLLLMMSLVLVSFPVEVWQQPRVPDSGATYLDLVVEPKF